MRKFTEATARNLLRRPLILGVPLFGLILLVFATLTLSVLMGMEGVGSLTSAGFGAVGYVVLRIVARFAKAGWEESLIFSLERRIRTKGVEERIEVVPSDVIIQSPDTLEANDLLRLKEAVFERIKSLRSGERLTFLSNVTSAGASLSEVRTSGRFDLAAESDRILGDDRFLFPRGRAYSLYRLPVTTDPLWLFGQLSRLPGKLKVIAAFRGVETSEIKRRIEVSRRNSARGDSAISDIDAEVTFEEASQVLQGLSRGDETVVEASLVIVSEEPLSLDEQMFCEEKGQALPILSALGIRRRFHRSHFVRATTAADLVPTVLDPLEDGAAILTTLRGRPLYFSPQDPRLEALHWLVVGASGSGKSFFSGLMLKRMIEQGCPMSVLFVDHNRSFRRFVRNSGGPYLESATLADLQAELSGLECTWNRSGSISGVELSDLDLNEKKETVGLLLGMVERFLRSRDTFHPFYLVLDESWALMRDHPLLVQRAFREFRKLNGAVIAITQSLHDFLTDESGQSIFQNTPIRVLLRQGEDLERYQGILSLNSVELERASRLRQQRGLFGECLIKTPFLSRLGRLYPTDAEHALLRTDNLRAELVAEAKARGVPRG